MYLVWNRELGDRCGTLSREARMSSLQMVVQIVSPVETFLHGGIFGAIAVCHWAKKVMILMDRLDVAVEVNFGAEALRSAVWNGAFVRALVFAQNMSPS